MTRHQKGYMTIGEVVETLKVEYPELSISKVRYLADEGLISPSRTSGGYRRFMPEDVDRLEIVLKLQKEKYLPLSLIREKLRSVDMGEPVPELKKTTKSRKRENLTLPLEKTELVSTKEVTKASGLSESEVGQLKTFGLVEPQQTDKGEAFTNSDIRLMSIVKELRKFGIQPRHLKFYESTAEREASLFQQILLPYTKKQSKEAEKRLNIALAELIKQFQELKSLLLKKSLRYYFRSH